MKKAIFTFLGMIMMFIFISQLNAQVPQAFNYQAVARNATGDLLDNQTVGLQLTIHQGSSSGTVVYSETHTLATNQFGLFTVAIGQGTVVSGTFATIDWSTGNYWLQVQMDPAGGTAYADMGTDQLLSVPFAMYSDGSLPAGTTGQTLRHDGSDWVANDFLYNSGSAVGIGTTTMPHTLSINGGASSGEIGLYTNLSGVTSSNGLRIGTSASSMNAWIWNYENAKLYFGTNNLERMTINADGKVGIGTTSPSQFTKFHVASNNRYAGYFTTDSASSTAAALYAEYTNTGNYVQASAVKGVCNAADYYGYGGWFISNYKGMVASASSATGSVYGLTGSGTSTGTGTAYGVYGSASSTSGTAYGIYCSGNGGYTGTWSAVSDRKFKKNIADYSNALENVLKLRTVTYDMNTEEYSFMGFSSEKQIGFIAQEMEDVFPTLVTKGVHPGDGERDEEIDYKGINYIGLIPVLVKAIQEQQAEIVSLKAEIKALKNK